MRFCVTKKRRNFVRMFITLKLELFDVISQSLSQYRLTLIRTVQNWRQTDGFAARGKSRKTSWLFAEYSRGITDCLAGEFRDWTMSLESTDIDCIGQVARISSPRDWPLNNADHCECCACLSLPTESGILLGFCYLPREPVRQLPTLATLQGEIVLLIAVAKTRPGTWFMF